MIDVIHLGDIDTITLDGSVPQDHLVIEHSRGDSITFITSSKSSCLQNPFGSYPERSEMAQILRSARARIQGKRIDTTTITTTNEVAGSILSIAMRNLASDEEGLRLSAFKVISRLGHLYNLDGLHVGLDRTFAGFYWLALSGRTLRPREFFGDYQGFQPCVGPKG